MEQFEKSLELLDVIDEYAEDIYHLETEGFIPLMCTILDAYCTYHPDVDVRELTERISSLVRIRYGILDALEFIASRN